jgi:5-methylcytosine-specific restriction protein B
VIAALENMFTACEKEFKEDYEGMMPFGHGVFAEVSNEDELHDLWNQRLSRFIRRPLLGAHPFADVIERNYPWKKRGYSLPSTTHTTSGEISQDPVAPTEHSEKTSDLSQQ